MPENPKRLSIERRIDLVFAFYRDAANEKPTSRQRAEEVIANLRREIRRQFEIAIKDDRERRESFIATIREQVAAIEAAISDLDRAGVPFELTDEELCPACGVPYKLHGTVHTGQWFAFVCAGITGSKLFISPDAAAKIVDLLQEKEDGRREPGDGGNEVRGDRDPGIPIPGE